MAVDWVLLAYRLPREPSTPRIAVWRQLRRLGALQLVDNLVALPRDSGTQEQLGWIADEVAAAGGEATIWFGRPGGRAQERLLSARMADRISADYRAVAEAAREASGRDEAARRRALARLRRALRAIRARDYFPPPERTEAEEAVERLGVQVESAR